MKLLASIFQIQKKIKRRTFEDAQQELLINLGREQFKKLVASGIRIPVVLL